MCGVDSWLIHDKKVLGLIPARGGSKGIPGKNIKCIAGKPLIAYTIEAARGSAYLDAVVTSTDSEEIAEVARHYGSEVPFMRPDELASDTAKSIDAVLHARDTLARMGRHFDVLVLLQPTSPLRTSKEIDGAIEFFFEHGMQGTVSVSEVAESPLLVRSRDDDGLLHPLVSVSSTVRRQDMPTYYRVDDGVFVNRCDELTAQTSLNDNPLGFVVPPIQGVDIDTMDDFVKADRLLRKVG